VEVEAEDRRVGDFFELGRVVIGICQPPGSADRAEWMAEWDAELRHVRLVSKKSWAFCRGALADAFWLRVWARRFSFDLASPARCLLWLGLLATTAWTIAANLPVARNLVLPSLWADARGLAAVAPDMGPGSNPLPRIQQVTFGEFRRWKNHRQTPFESLVFYQITGGPVLRTEPSSAQPVASEKGRRRVREAAGFFGQSECVASGE
jgi:hypothetical protein